MDLKYKTRIGAPNFKHGWLAWPRLFCTQAIGVFMLLIGSFFAQACQAATQYPLEIFNCGRTIVFEKKPQSVVAVGQNSAEILFALGLGDKVKATALWQSSVAPQFERLNRQIPILAKNEPSFESIIAKRPDMVANHLEWAIGPHGTSATYAQFDMFDIPVYTAPSDCVGKDNRGGGDGWRQQPFNMDLIYLEIAQLAEIFDVADKGQALINTLQQREIHAKETIKALNLPQASIVFWYSSASPHGAPYVGGGYGPPAYMAHILGLNNIIETKTEWPTVGWETIIKKRPDIIVLAEAERKRFPMDEAKIKLEFLKTNPTTRIMESVRQNHIAIIDAQTLNPTIRIIDGIEALAAAISKMDFSSR